MNHPVPLLLLVPLVGAFACLFVPRTTAKWVAVLTTAVEFALVLPLYGTAFGGGPQVYAPAAATFAGLNFGFSLGCDAVSWWLILLTAVLMPLAVCGSFGGITTRQRGYYFWLTVLLMPMVGVFLARDAILFYVFFELTLIPMFFLIGIWGGENREWAAKKFFIFTFVGSVFTLAGLIYVGVQAGSFDLATMTLAAQRITDPTTKVLLFCALAAGFAVKVPLFPVHTWLPLAHTVAPTAGSVILAGVLLKLGTYGLYKIAIPMGLLTAAGVGGVNGDGLLPVVAHTVIPVVAILAVIGVIYGALVAWVQVDVKKLVAYSSVSHLGFCVLGLVALNTYGVQGSVFYMINHGISTGALFLMIGMIYDRYHTRLFADYGGLGRVMPVFSFFLVLFTMSSIGLPGTNGFISEFFTIAGAFMSPHLGPIYGMCAATGVVLGAIYMLYMVARLVFGPLKLPEVHDAAHTSSAFGSQTDAGQSVSPDAHHDGHGKAQDLTGREIAILTPLALAVIVLGVLPTPLLKSIQPSVERARLPMVTRDDAGVGRPAARRATPRVIPALPQN